MRQVAIVGAAMTKFGELWDRSLRDIGLESGMLALMDGGVYIFTQRDLAPVVSHRFDQVLGALDHAGDPIP